MKAFVQVIMLKSLDCKLRFAETIKQLRGDKTKTALGRILGVSHTAITNWEDCTHVPDIQTLSKVAKLTGYTLDEFMCFLEGKPLVQRPNVAHIKREIEGLRNKELAEVFRFTSDRLVAIAESSGR